MRVSNIMLVEVKYKNNWIIWIMWILHRKKLRKDIIHLGIIIIICRKYIREINLVIILIILIHYSNVINYCWVLFLNKKYIIIIIIRNFKLNKKYLKKSKYIHLIRKDHRVNPIDTLMKYSWCKAMIKHILRISTKSIKN